MPLRSDCGTFKMTEQGEVYKIDKKNRAIVRFPRTTACKNCNMCFKPRNEMFVEVTIQNTLNAKVGDFVAVSMGKKAVLGASIIVYLVPIVLVGAILALTYKIDEVLSFVFAAVGLVVSETLIALTDRILRKKTEYLPKMVEILGRSSETEITKESDGSEKNESEGLSVDKYSETVETENGFEYRNKDFVDITESETVPKTEQKKGETGVYPEADK